MVVNMSDISLCYFCFSGSFVLSAIIVSGSGSTHFKTGEKNKITSTIYIVQKYFVSDPHLVQQQRFQFVGEKKKG